MSIKIHDNTVEKVKEIIEKDKKQGIRIEALSCSCKGVNFKIYPDNIYKENDYVIEDKSGIKIIIDKNIKNMFSDATIEYKNTISGWEFSIY